MQAWQLRVGTAAGRRELKFIVSEEKAAAIREHVRCFLVPDKYMAQWGVRGYPVCSLYLDSPSLLLYEQTQQGQKNRFKLRIRFYDDDPAHPAFAEIKRRETVVVKKQRAAITREGAMELLAGMPGSVSILADSAASERELAALHEFSRLATEIRAVGCSYVSYHREAYCSDDGNDLRVTFDRELQGGGYQRGAPIALPTQVRRPELDGVILEFKFTNRFPPLDARSRLPVRLVPAVGTQIREMCRRP